MARVLMGFALGITLAASLPGTADEGPPTQKLTAEERKDLEASRKELAKSADQHYLAGRLADATTALTKSLAVARRLYPTSEFPSGHAELATSMNNLAFVLWMRRSYAEAEPLYREALAMRRRLYPDQDHPELAQSLVNLAFVLKDQGKYADAEPLFRDTVAMNRRLHSGADHVEVVRSLNNLAVLLQARNKFVEAVPLYRDALEMNRRLSQGRDHPDLVNGLINLARALHVLGRYADAEPHSREALEMSRRLHPKEDHPLVAASLNNLARVLRDRARFTDAEALFRAALEMNRRLYPKQDHADLAMSLNNLAGVLRAQSKFGEAETLYREALQSYHRLYPKQDHPFLAVSLNNLASTFQAQGKDSEAETVYRDAVSMMRRLYPKQDNPELATTLNNLAVILKTRGKYSDAEPVYREALEMTRRLCSNQDHPELATSLYNLALVFQAQGKEVEAEKLARTALEMERRLHAKEDHPQLVHSLINLSAVLQFRGKYAEAETPAREALEMTRRLFPKQDHVDLAQAMNNLGLVHKDRWQFHEAEPLFREALAMRRRLHAKQDHTDVAGSLNNLAVVLEARGKYADAERLYREALDVYGRLDARQNQAERALGLNNLAFVLKDQGKYAEAEPLFREALQLVRQLHPRQNTRQLACSLNNLAFVLQDQGKRVEAEPLHRDAMRMFRDLAETYAVTRTEGDSLTLAASYPFPRDLFLSNARALRTEPGKVYAEVWSSKANLARFYERRALAARAAAANPRATELLAQLTGHRRRRADLLLAPMPTDPTTRNQRDDELQGHDRQIEKLDADLRPLLPVLDRAEKLANAIPDDLQKALPADAVVVDFLRYYLFERDPRIPGKAGEKQTASYLAFVLTRNKVSWVDLGSAAPIEEAVDAWRRSISSGKDIPATLPARVRELTWAKVQREIPSRVKVVYVSPDLTLCQVPWAALPGDKPGAILLEDHTVAVVPHALFLLDKMWPQEPQPNRPSRILVVGGVAYDAEAAAVGQVAFDRGDLPLKPGQKVGWAALPGAEAEAKGVAGAAEKKKLDFRMLGGEKASVSTVLAELPRARYAHLGTHGFFADPSFRSAFQVDPKLFEMSQRGERIGAGALSPLVMTGLVLAGANRPNTPGRGVRTGEALVDLDLSGLDVAVLSACETGLGDVAGGEGTFGLQRAFHLAGTRDVVASLWKVPDRPTAALMALFYRNLWEKGMSPVEALRQAQLEIYRHPDKVPELAAGFRGKFVEVPGTEEMLVKPGVDGKAHPRLWAAFSLSGPGR